MQLTVDLILHRHGATLFAPSAFVRIFFVAGEQQREFRKARRPKKAKTFAFLEEDGGNKWKSLPFVFLCSLDRPYQSPSLGSFAAIHPRSELNKIAYKKANFRLT
jgi:hypothetical protein